MTERPIVRTGFGRAARLGLVATVLITIGSYGVGDIPRNSPVLSDLHLSWMSYGHGKTLCSLAFWIGIAALVVAWVQIGRIVRTTDIPANLMRRTAAVWAAPLLIAVPIYSRDVYAYLAQGSLFAHGYNPYSDGPALLPGPLVDSMAQVWATTTAPYGPAFMLITRGVADIVGNHVILGVLLMKLVMLPGFALALWAIPRLAQHFPRRPVDTSDGDAGRGAYPAYGSWLVLLNPMLLVHLVGGPHVELLMFGVLAAGLVLVLEGRHGWGIAVLALAASIKITAALALPFVLWIWLAHNRSARDQGELQPRRDWREATKLTAAIVGIAMVVFGVFTLAVGHGLGWLTGLGWADRIINWLTIPTAVAHLVTLVAAPFTALHLGPVLSVTRTIGEVVLALIAVTVWWKSRHTARSAMVGAAWVMFAVLLLEPSTLPWYYSWALVIAAAFDLGRRWSAAVVFACVFQLIVFQPDDSILMYNITDVLIAAALSGLAAWSLLRPDPLRLGVVRGYLWPDGTAPKVRTPQPAPGE
ncbi:polyprenol phosphomannose-dependent alpha 1,6 mannosyltransferase MptB [Jongsikchunia kroppenstedtii]|uniref:polyprenol phosphomannose-dependent alpha 1,6 mannosyltransferase MptB n=1 Tax=Jongsikchunia kroppenstedtii TaxID=1121721 RepID=UPI00035F5A0B|nr:polyprenol phosphomannose-dependent alpha 1,6 mannosyltransferase MptB [Jongsikchunia kroppenstedtii]